jgi:hypothetical protein
MRAQARDDPDAIDVHDDGDGDTSPDQSLQKEDASRPVLRDITDENYSTTIDEVMEQKQSTRGKNSKAGRKKDKLAEQDQAELDVTEDLAQQASSVEQGGEEQAIPKEQNNEAPETLASAVPLPTCISELENTMLQTPEKPVATTSKTPKFDPELHAPAIEPSSAAPEQEDSFVNSIKTRSPIKLSREPSRDSFVDSIKSRSPAKRTSRIEDSIEAMDALEEAIEEVSKLPQIKHLESPVKERQSPPRTLPPSARKTALDTKVVLKTPKSASKTPSKNKPTELKPAPPRTNSGRVSTVEPTTKALTVNKSVSRPATVAPKSTRPSTTLTAPSTMSFSNSPLKQLPEKKRVTSGALSTSKPAFVPAKSSKPPTRSTFILPGEAVAAKFKTQREERAKQEEEKNKKTFKARPAPSMSGRPSVAPRENKASLARKSSAQITPGQSEDKENLEPKRPRPSTVPGTTLKTLDVKKVRPEGSTVRANSSVRRTTTNSTPPTSATRRPVPDRPTIAPKPITRPSMAPRVASLTRPVKSSPLSSSSLKSTVAIKASGKDVYARTKLEREQEEKEKREKEDAAKKARAEAAERGRLASREWAEKQKQRQLRIVEEKKATAVASVAVSEVGAI